MGAAIAAIPAVIQGGKSIYDAVKGKGSKTNALMDVANMGATLYGGYQDSKAQQKNSQAVQQQNAAMQQMIQGQMGKGPGAAESALLGFNPGSVPTASAGNVNTSFSAQQIDVGALGLPNISGQKNFNAGQDALMQMVNRDAASQLGMAGTSLESLAKDGGMVDVESMLGAVGAQMNANLSEQVARQNASVSGLGQLAGTASRIGEARLRNRALIDQNSTMAQTRNAALESAMGRKLSAAGTLGNLNLQGYQNQMAAANSLGNFANMQANSELGAANTRLAGMQSNQSAGLQAQGMGLQAEMANQQAALNATQMNQAALGQANAQRLAGLQSAGQLEGGRNQQNIAMMAMLGGQNVQTATGANPMIEAGQTAQVLPGIMRKMATQLGTTGRPAAFGSMRR